MKQDHVLVIDDEASVRDAVTDLLDFEGVAVLTAVNGAKGIQLYQERCDEIGVVLLDLTMPGLSGVETLCYLRELNPHVKIVLSSGYSREDVMQDVPDSVAYDYLQKPYNFAVLVDTVKRNMPTPQEAS